MNLNLELIAKVLLPETLVLVAILVTIVTSLFNNTKKHNAVISAIFLFLATLSCYLPIFFQDSSFFAETLNQKILFDSFVNDQYSLFLRALIYGTSFLIVNAASKYLEVLESPAEYYPIILSASLGGAFLTAANDFLLFFVALETLGLSAILLSAYARYNKASNESGIKYLITSATSTALFLMAFSFIYGLTASTNFTAIAINFERLNSMGLISAPLLTLISVLFCGVIAFKLGAVPFHNWAPDVYSGAPTSTTLFLSTVSKVAVFGVAIRIFSSVFYSQSIMVILMIFAVASVILGNYVGVIQMISRGTVKRLLAYSSIAQVGYLLIALSIFAAQSLTTLLIYLTIYVLMNAGAFLAAIYFEQITKSTRIYDYAGMIRKRPWMTIAFSFSLISLAGLPLIPAGFIAKFFLFSSAFAAKVDIISPVIGPILAVIGLLGSVIALFYYVYLVKIMVVDDMSTAVRSLADQDEQPSPMIKFATFAAVAKLVVVGFFMMDFIAKLSSQSITSLLSS